MFVKLLNNWYGMNGVKFVVVGFIVCYVMYGVDLCLMKVVIFLVKRKLNNILI